MANYSTQQFESALLMHGVQITGIYKDKEIITNIIGYINDKRYVWDAEGHCFQLKRRIPEFDLQFTPVPRFYVPSTYLYDLTKGRKYPIEISLKGFKIIDNKGCPRYMTPVIKSEFVQ